MLCHVSVDLSAPPTPHPSVLHLAGRGRTFRGAADVSFLPHALDAAGASRWNIWHGGFGGFQLFVALRGQKMGLNVFKHV